MESYDTFNWFFNLLNQKTFSWNIFYPIEKVLNFLKPPKLSLSKKVERLNPGYIHTNREKKETRGMDMRRTQNH